MITVSFSLVFPVSGAGLSGSRRSTISPVDLRSTPIQALSVSRLSSLCLSSQRLLMTGVGVWYGVDF